MLSSSVFIELMVHAINSPLCKNAKKSLNVSNVELQGVSVQNDKFKIMIAVGLSYIRKNSWCLHAPKYPPFEFHQKRFKKKLHRLASTASDREGTK